MSLICVNNKPLEGNEVAPPLIEGKEYKVEHHYQCHCGEIHYNVGIKSNYNWITCYRCREELPDGSRIHWCHSSRFQRKAQ